MRNAVLVFGLLLSAFPTLHAEEPQVNPRELLAKADEAAANLTSVSYVGSFHGEGAATNRIPKASGHVVAQRGVTQDRTRMRIECTFAENGSAQGQPVKFATDGLMAFRIEEALKKITTGKAGDALSPESNALVPPKYLVKTPYRMDLSVSDIRYKGVEKIDDVECHVVQVTYNAAAGMGMTYWLGKNDYLLRRVENTISLREPGNPQPLLGKIVFVASKLEANPKLEDGIFKLATPEGYTESTFEPKPQLGPNGLLAAGGPAPDWDLKTPDGKTVSLKSLRGKVVIMDFWATWCGPCKMAMPGLEKLHQRYKDKPVAILGVNCRQRGEPLEKVLGVVKDLGLNYTQVIEGDKVAEAYQVKGIPCFYVIDPEGKIVYATSGWQPNHDEMLGQMIEELLKIAGKQAAATAKP